MKESFGFVADVGPGGKLQLTPTDRRGLDMFLSMHPGAKVEATFKRYRATRSNQQLRWYWGCVLKALSEHTGYTAEELHEYCKSRFLPKSLVLTDGNGVVVDDRVIGGTTVSLSTKSMAEYCEAIREFAASELGVNIPDPDPAWAAA